MLSLCSASRSSVHQHGLIIPVSLYWCVLLLSLASTTLSLSLSPSAKGFQHQRISVTRNNAPSHRYSACSPLAVKHQQSCGLDENDSDGEDRTIMIGDSDNIATGSTGNRRSFLKIAPIVSVSSAVAASSILFGNPNKATAEVQDSLDVQNFLRTGVDGSGNMGVSSQAGKSRPETGVVFRDGSEVFQDGRTGSVSAEILVGTKVKPIAVLASFSSPWPLAKGSVFDVECRDGKTGDGAFLAVSALMGGEGNNLKGKSIEDIPTSFLFERLFSPTGRFSFYGPPTDVKVVRQTKSSLSSSLNDNIGKDKGVRFVEVTFSNLSQSTGAEIPRRAIVAATIPEGTDNVIMLVASASAPRWKQSSVQTSILNTVQSFKAVPAPKSNLKIRPKKRGGELDFS
jgi:hypothetical protein